MKLGNIIFIARFTAMVIILLLIDFEQLALILRSINFDLLILAILLELAGFLIWTLKWKLIIGKLEKIKITTLIDRAIYMFFVIIIAYAATVIMRLFHIGERVG